MTIRSMAVTVVALAATLAAPATSASALPSAGLPSTTPSVTPSVPTLVTVSARSSSAVATSFATATRKATNRQRVHHHLARLRQGACLTRYARAQAEAMARSGRTFHQALSPIEAGCRIGWTGENVAHGYRTGGDTVNRGWMHSATHRANLLNRHFRRVGVVAVRGAGDVWYVSEVFGRRA